MKTKGFTLIELVIVIVILGILAAVAVPKFVDLEDEAATAAVEGVAGALASAASINYAAYKGSNGTKGQSITGTQNSEICSEGVLDPIMQGGIPDGYLVSSGTTTLADGVAYCEICNDLNGNNACGADEPKVDNIPIPLTN
jgi:MSHA pilin protein MshA